jgi:anti-sigma factor RsiW
VKDEDLLRYLDGEMSPREARQLETELESSEESRNKLAAMRQLGEVLVARFEGEGNEVESALSASWEKIAAQLPEPRSARPRIWDRLREWFEVYRAHVLTGAVAAAAGAFLAVWLRSGAPVPALAAGSPTEVESLDVEGGSGTIFQIASDDKNEPETTVIWLTPRDDGDDETERVPL